MVQKDRFWNKTADKYAAQPIADQASYEIKMDMTRDFFTPQSEVLEIGCGTGSTALLHAPFVKHIHATDLSARMIEIAQCKQAEQGVENVSFEVADIDAGPINAKRYDAVLAMSLIHLVEHRQALLKRVHDQLKPGGVFISSTTCLGDGVAFFKPILWFGKLFRGWPDVSFFKAEALIEEIEQAGFTIVQQWRPGPKKALFLVARKAG